MNAKLEENDIVLCTVKRIEGTTVFLEIEDNGEGTMIFSEVSPGRIRNIREFVVPNKKIVCKILRIKDGHPQLSLRRVSAKERNEVLDFHKKARTLKSMIKSVLKEKTSIALEKIKQKYELADFLDEAREDPKILSKFFTPSQTKELTKIFALSKQTKEKEIKKILTLTSKAESGLLDIQKSLEIKQNNVDISYLGSSKFSLIIKAKTYKEANSQMEEILEEIKDKTKKLHITLEVKEK